VGSNSENLNVELNGIPDQFAINFVGASSVSKINGVFLETSTYYND